jgi:hypothetical protein
MQLLVSVYRTDKTNDTDWPVSYHVHPRDRTDLQYDDDIDVLETRVYCWQQRAGGRA